MNWLYESIRNTDIVADILAIMIAWLLYRSDKSIRASDSRKKYWKKFNKRLKESTQGNRNYSVHFINQRAYFFGTKRIYTHFLNLFYFNKAAAEIYSVTNTGVIFSTRPEKINSKDIYTYGFLPFRWIADVDFDGTQKSSVTQIYVKATYFIFPFRRIYSYHSDLYYIESDISFSDRIRIYFHNSKIHVSYIRDNLKKIIKFH